MKVVLTWYANEDEVRRVRRAAPKDTDLFVPPVRPYLARLEVTRQDIAHEVGDADVFMGWAVPKGVLEAAKALKALIWLNTGCDNLDVRMLKSRGIQVANVRGANASAVSEHAMALLLCLAKRLVVKHQAVLDAHWEPDGGGPEFGAILLEGQTLAIIGLGLVGTAVAKRAKAFDMRVLGVRRHPDRGGAHVDAVHGPAQLHAVLAEADFVVLATPLTLETEGMIDEKAIEAMKSSACLINIARGSLVLERPLFEALKSWRLSGYAADVWWNYVAAWPPTYHFPIPSRTDLQRLPNVVGTGSQAAHTPEVKDRIVDSGIESLAAFLRGEPMPRSVDLDLGY
jgi:phosphoglycerate dehydrogenase-like enzyme